MMTTKGNLENEGRGQEQESVQCEEIVGGEGVSCICAEISNVFVVTIDECMLKYDNAEKEKNWRERRAPNKK